MKNHGYTEKVWDLYLSGGLRPEVAARMDAHLLSCPDCASLYEREVPILRLLYAGAKEARENLTVSEDRLKVLYAELMAGIRAAEMSAGTPGLVETHLDFLKELLVPFLGSEASERALGLAASGTIAGSVNRINKDNWMAFLDRLATISAIVCGDVFANLIRENALLSVD